MNKIGCEKCDYTGFSFGKIPCVCTEKKPPADLDSGGDIDLDITKVRAFVNGIPVDYDIDTQFKPDPPGDIYGCSSQKKEIQIGDPLWIGDAFIGRAFAKVDADGYVDILMYGDATWGATCRVHSDHVYVGEQPKHLSLDLPTHQPIVNNLEYCRECGHKL